MSIRKELWFKEESLMCQNTSRCPMVSSPRIEGPNLDMSRKREYVCSSSYTSIYKGMQNYHEKQTPRLVFNVITTLGKISSITRATKPKIKGIPCKVLEAAVLRAISRSIISFYIFLFLHNQKIWLNILDHA